MHPINNKFFGDATGKIAISFHNGTSVVSGSIVKQTGTTKFVVTDGVDNYTVKLAQTTSLATALTAGFATITVTPFGGGTEHVKKLYSTICYTTEGHKFGWRLGTADQAGEADIAMI